MTLTAAVSSTLFFHAALFQTVSFWPPGVLYLPFFPVLLQSFYLLRLSTTCCRSQLLPRYSMAKAVSCDGGCPPIKPSNLVLQISLDQNIRQGGVTLFFFMSPPQRCDWRRPTATVVACRVSSISAAESFISSRWW